jgi:hypothetical protein
VDANQCLSIHVLDPDPTSQHVDVVRIHSPRSPIPPRPPRLPCYAAPPACTPGYTAAFLSTSPHPAHLLPIATFLVALPHPHISSLVALSHPKLPCCGVMEDNTHRRIPHTLPSSAASPLPCCTVAGRRPHSLVFDAPSPTKSFSLAGPHRVTQTRWVVGLGWKRTRRRVWRRVAVPGRDGGAGMGGRTLPRTRRVPFEASSDGESNGRQNLRGSALWPVTFSIP